jgi:RNA polymerase sigma factor (sigma-70 family)
MKKGWVLTQDAFEALLKWLDEDRECAAGKYEAIRSGLIKIFTCRGCSEAEDLADETMNRVASKVPEIARDYEGDPIPYFIRVSKNVEMEYARRSRRVIELDEARETPDQTIPEVDTDDDAQYDCLEKCLENLSADNRQLVIDYYQREKQAKIRHRQVLAAQLGIAVNALRIRAYRIRSDLRACVQRCMREQPAQLKCLE